MTPEQLQEKLGQLRRLLALLAEIPQSSLDEFRSDARNLDATLHRLQVAIQILIDVGSHVVARLGLGAPTSSRDLLVRLESAGHLPAGSVDRFGPIFGFRNRVVHLYDRIDDAIVYSVLKERTGDLQALAALYLVALDER